MARRSLWIVSFPSAIASGILDTLNQINASAKPQRFHVQVASYRNPAYAERMLNELLEMDFPAEIEEKDGFYRIRVGDFETLDQAVAMEQRLRRAGYQTWIVTT